MNAKKVGTRLKKASTRMTAYDELNYEGGIFSQTHPQRLQAVAKLFGLDAPSLKTCSILELGCGDGANLIPMAFHLPAAKLVGVDLAENPIAYGQERISRLGLSNIELLQGDVSKLGSSLGKFDYIIAHGLYSWVPTDIRPAILKLIQSSLTERGVAYVSFNALPGCRLRHMVRDLIHFRFGEKTADPTILPEVRAFLTTFAGLSIDENDHTVDRDLPKDRYLQTLKGEIKFALSLPDHVLFHDDLSNFATPFYLHEFATAAEGHGLQYLGEANMETMFPKSGSESFSNAAKHWGNTSKDPWIAQQQYIDYALGRRFKQSLLCHQSSSSAQARQIALKREVGPDTLSSMHVRTKLMAQSAGKQNTGKQGASDQKTWLSRDLLKFEFRGRVVSIDEPLAKAALSLLGQVYPDSLAIADLISESLAICVKAGLKYERHASHQAMQRMFWSLMLGGHVELLGEAISNRIIPPAKQREGEEFLQNYRPRLSALLRDALTHAQPLTGSIHEGFRLDEQRSIDLALLMDGTKSIADLAGEQPSEKIEQFVQFLHRLGTLDHSTGSRSAP
jgi:SAM-dependent methyltransferase